MNTHEITRTRVEKVTNEFVKRNTDRMEQLLRAAFLEGYGAGLDAAHAIYNPDAAPLRGKL